MAHSVRVLLIDENPSDAAELCEKLSKFKSLSLDMHGAPTLAEGIALLRDARFDVMLVDLGTPESNAIATLQELQACAEELPILALSSEYQESAALEIVRAGAQDYLVKNRMNVDALNASSGTVSSAKGR